MIAVTMSGHSKWANIKYRKAAQDEKKGKVYSKLARDIMVAVKRGGKDPGMNIDLRNALFKAKEFRLPKENIDRAVKRGAGEIDGAVFEEIAYEGYAPGGVGVIVEVITENKNRTAADVRHVFDKHGGALGSSGSVKWKFKKRGLVVIDAVKDKQRVSEDDVITTALDLGVEDIKTLDDGFELLCEPEQFDAVKAGAAAAGYTVKLGEISLLPATMVPLDPAAAKQVLSFLMEIQDMDDVQNVVSDGDFPDDVLASVA